jgi:ERF superfamily
MNQDVIDAPVTATLGAAQQASSGIALQRRGDIVGASASLQETSGLIQVIAVAARDPSVDIEKMERLWVMHEKLKARADEEAFNAAMNKAQGEMGRVSVDAANKQTRSTYATYGQLDKAVRPIYTRHGFSISFNEGDGAPEGHARILAYVSHSSGHTRTYKADIPNDGKGAKGGDVMTKTHATGSAHSYGRRYLLKNIFNIAIGENDNDGNGDDSGAEDRPTAPKSPDVVARDRLLDAGRDAAMNGMAPLNKWWASLNPRQQKDMGQDFGPMRKAARQADEEAQR